MRLKSRGLGRKELVMDFREYTVTRDGDEIVIEGTIREPVHWDFSIRMCEDDLPGLAKVAASKKMIGFLAKALFKRNKDAHWSVSREEHLKSVKEHAEATKVAAAKKQAEQEAKQEGKKEAKEEAKKAGAGASGANSADAPTKRSRLDRDRSERPRPAGAPSGTRSTEAGASTGAGTPTGARRPTGAGTSTPLPSSQSAGAPKKSVSFSKRSTSPGTTKGDGSQEASVSGASLHANGSNGAKPRSRPGAETETSSGKATAVAAATATPSATERSS